MATPGFHIRIDNIEEVQNFIGKLPERTFPNVKEAFEHAVTIAANQVKLMKDMKVRSGALKRSIQQEVKGTDFRTLSASVFSAQGSGAKEVVYAPIQEYGGTVRAKNAYKNVPGGPYLNIPIADNLTGAGVMRESAKMVFMSGQGRIAKAKSGRWLVFKGDKLMFVLLKEVTLNPRLGMRKAAEDQVPTLLSKLGMLLIEDNA